jgi:hypothetical protein
MNVLRNEMIEGLLLCPYCDTDADVCAASLTAMKLEKSLRLNRCSDENYDNCALFLSKSLRLRR